MSEKINCNRYGDLTVSCVINHYISFEYINFCISVTAGLHFSYTLPELSLSALFWNCVTTVGKCKINSVMGNGYFPVSSIYFIYGQLSDIFHCSCKHVLNKNNSL